MDGFPIAAKSKSRTLKRLLALMRIRVGESSWGRAQYLQVDSPGIDQWGVAATLNIYFPNCAHTGNSPRRAQVASKRYAAAQSAAAASQWRFDVTPRTWLASESSGRGFRGPLCGAADQC
jgi:hypothetical protein